MPLWMNRLDFEILCLFVKNSCNIYTRLLLHVSDLAKGIYFLVFDYSDGSNYSEKIISTAKPLQNILIQEVLLTSKY